MSDADATAEPQNPQDSPSRDRTRVVDESDHRLRELPEPMPLFGSPDDPITYREAEVIRIEHRRFMRYLRGRIDYMNSQYDQFLDEVREEIASLSRKRQFRTETMEGRGTPADVLDRIIERLENIDDHTEYLKHLRVVITSKNMAEALILGVTTDKIIRGHVKPKGKGRPAQLICLANRPRPVTVDGLKITWYTTAEAVAASIATPADPEKVHITKTAPKPVTTSREGTAAGIGMGDLVTFPGQPTKEAIWIDTTDDVITISWLDGPDTTHSPNDPCTIERQP